MQYLISLWPMLQPILAGQLRHFLTLLAGMLVALGALGPGGVFNATEVLAKHDERYMPPEVVDALKRSGRWKEGEQ